MIGEILFGNLIYNMIYQHQSSILLKWGNYKGEL